MSGNLELNINFSLNKVGPDLNHASGVLPRIVDFLDEGDFRRNFEDKAPVDALAKSVATRLVMRSDSVLVGMAAIAAAPDRYAVDFAGRRWA